MEWSLFSGKISKQTSTILLFTVVPLVLFFILYTYYRIFKVVKSKCVNCKKRPKLGLRGWIWEIFKVAYMPWKKVSVFCQGCQRKVEHKGWIFVEKNKK